MAKKLAPIETKIVEKPVDIVENPAHALAPVTTPSDFSKMVDSAKAEISKAPTTRTRRTKAEMQASGQPAQTVSTIPAVPLTPEQIEMRGRKISNIVQAGSGALSQILIKSEHMTIEKKVADEWSKDLVDVAIAFPEFETYISPKALAVAGLMGSTAIMVGGMVAIYKAHKEIELKKLNATPIK